MSDVDAIARQLADAGFVVTIDREVESAGAAAVLGLTPKTLRNWRSELMGPDWKVHGRIVLYAIADLIAWRRDAGVLGESRYSPLRSIHEHETRS